MDVVKSNLKKSTNIKFKSTTNSTNSTLTTRHSAKVLESQVRQFPASSKRGLKRKLQVPVQLNVKRSRLRGFKPKSKLQSLNVQKTTITKRIKEKSKVEDTEDSPDDHFTEEEEEAHALSESSDEDKAPIKNKVNTKKSQLNGDKNPKFYTSPRVRKPNPKFQDFITSPQVRLIPITEKPAQEKVETPKIKIKPKAKITPAVPLEKDPLDIVNMKLADGKEDEIVRSFLPVIDKHKVNYDLDGGAFRMVKSGKTRSSSGKVENVLPSVKDTETEDNSEKSKVESKSDTPNETATIPPDLTPVPSSTATLTPLVVLPPIAETAVNSTAASVSNESKIKFDAIQNSRKTNNHTVRKYTRIPVERKGKNMFPNSKKKDEVRYCLIESENVSYRTKSPKASDVDFNKLVRTLKSVKLPASNWKIRIVVSRQQTITEVTFTNKEVNERCVKFSRVFTGYIITFGKSVVKLVGAPNKISSFNDVTILLDIIHNLALNDPILQYVADKDK